MGRPRKERPVVEEPKPVKPRPKPLPPPAPPVHCCKPTKVPFNTMYNMAKNHILNGNAQFIIYDVDFTADGTQCNVPLVFHGFNVKKSPWFLLWTKYLVFRGAIVTPEGESTVKVLKLYAPICTIDDCIPSNDDSLVIGSEDGYSIKAVI